MHSPSVDDMNERRVLPLLLCLFHGYHFGVLVKNDLSIFNIDTILSMIIINLWSIETKVY